MTGQTLTCSPCREKERGHAGLRTLNLTIFRHITLNTGACPQMPAVWRLFLVRKMEKTHLLLRCFHDSPQANRQQPCNNEVRHNAARRLCIRGNVRMLEILIANGADPSERDSCGMAALHIACQSGQLDAAAKLISCNPLQSLDERNPDGLTPFQPAVQQDHTDLACLLVQSGADIHLTFFVKYVLRPYGVVSRV